MASVVGKQSGSAVSVAWLVGGARSPRKFVAVIMLAVLLSGVLGLAIYKRADMADLIDRASKMLGQSASAAGGLPLAKSLVALLDQRSPGERTKGELARDKQRFAARPQQRALGKVRPALPAPFVKALTTPVPDAVQEAVPVAGLTGPLVPDLPLGPSLVSAPLVLVGGGGPGGGGGGPGGGGGGPGPGPGPGIEVPPVVTPVPEPATWLTMILGFYILARALRRQRPVIAHGAALTA